MATLTLKLTGDYLYPPEPIESEVAMMDRVNLDLTLLNDSRPIDLSGYEIYIGCEDERGTVLFEGAVSAAAAGLASATIQPRMPGRLTLRATLVSTDGDGDYTIRLGSLSVAAADRRGMVATVVSLTKRLLDAFTESREATDQSIVATAESREATAECKTATQKANDAAESVNDSLERDQRVYESMVQATADAVTATNNATDATDRATAAAVVAENATVEANNAIANAQSAIEAATSAAETIDTAVANAQTAVIQAETAVTNANQAIADVQEASQAAENASIAAVEAQQVAERAAAQAEAVITDAVTATTNANAAAGRANTATTNANTATANANTATANCNAAVAAMPTTYVPQAGGTITGDLTVNGTINGTLSGNADTANTANYAIHADTADTATNATNAGHATSADHAGTADSASSATSATQDGSGNVITATYATKAEDAEKLPLSGGTMTGTLRNNESYAPFIGRVKNNLSTSGAYCDIFRVEKENSTTILSRPRFSYNGNVFLCNWLFKSDTKESTLKLFADGGLFWNDKVIECAAEKGDGYLKLSDGRQFCFGTATINNTAGINISYPRAFKAAPIVVAIPVGSSTFNLHVAIGSRTATAFNATGYSNAGTAVSWITCSYIAIGEGAD